MANPKKHLDEMASPEQYYAEARPINSINAELSPLATSPLQGRVDTAKSAKYNFSVVDAYNRAKRFHPELSIDDLDAAYRGTPVIASDKSYGDSYGIYKYSPDNPSTDRVMVYPNLIDRDNKNLGSTITHELSHNYFDKVLKGNLASEEKQYLNAAYPDTIFFENDDEYHEKQAVNRQLRDKISSMNGGVTGAELDKAIDNISEDDLMKEYFNLNGYTEDPLGMGRKYMMNDNKWDINKVNNIKQAMKYVASVPNQRRYSIRDKGANVNFV